VADDSDARNSDVASRNLKAMKVRAEKLRVEFSDEADPKPLELIPEPVFRYSDPARIDVDGTHWLFTRNRRPIADVTIFLARPPATKWTYSFISLDDRPLRATGRPQWRWEPRPQVRKWIAVDGDVPADANSRLIAMRQTLRQFEASESYEGQSHELRFLPKPLYRYAAEASSITDGALFAFAHEAAPSVLMQIEARVDSSGKNAWHISAAAGGSAEKFVNRGKEVVWNFKPAGPPFDPTASAYSVWSQDDLNGEENGILPEDAE
jgi:hypothetical protein